jgi:hypothetical protein
MAAATAEGCVATARGPIAAETAAVGKVWEVWKPGE